MTQRSEIDWSRLRASLVAVAALPMLTVQVNALSFGAEQVSSSLGQPLSVSIPLLGATGDSLEAACFRLVAPTRSDGIPSITQARVEVQSSSSPPRLLIRGSRPIDEPIVRLTLEAGCDTPIRREYTILLDPPTLKLPDTMPAAAGEVRREAAPRPALRATTTANGDDRESRPSRVSASRAKAPSKNVPVERRESGGDLAKPRTATSAEKSGKRGLDSLSRRSEKSAAAQDQLQVRGGPTNTASTVDAASLAALAIPRLKISSDLPSFAPSAIAQPQAGNELQTAIANDRRSRLLAAPIEEDLAPRLEADLVVAKRRLAELQLQLGGSTNVAEAGTPANAANGSSQGVPARVATKPPTPAASAPTSWLDEVDWLSWIWVPALALVAGLAGFLLFQRRAKNRAPKFADVDPVTVVHTQMDEFDTVMPATTVALTNGGQTLALTPGSANSEQTTQTGKSQGAKAGETATATEASSSHRAEQEATDKLNSPLFQLQDTASQVDVSVLSQATDEAQVYADLGRTDKAIAILRSHIQNLASDRASPVPWLMIFDLYRRTNNRAGYDELAPQFRKHFNGRMPDWDSYGHELALDDGLEAFPHLVARIERDWGKPEARKFLDELLYDNRGGSRLGFSLAAYRDLLLLLQVHDVLTTLPNSGVTDSDWESRGANDDDGTPRWDLELSMIEPPKTGELDSFLKGMPKPDAN
ncbi:MAG: hypothetical protein ABL985_20760 [Casimicrobium sp.]